MCRRSASFWRLLLPAVIAPLTLPGVPPECVADLLANASCNENNTITVSWSFYELPGYPTGHPEWTGYDVLRRSVNECGDFVRVNPEPFTRVPGESQSFTYVDMPSSLEKTYEYRVVLIDANRQQLDPFMLCGICAQEAYVTCPPNSAPLTHGTLEDWVFALNVLPCAGSCYPSVYFEGVPTDLRRYVGTDTAVRFYGQAGCGTVEGCRMVIDHYEITPCDVSTPTCAASWGHFKGS